MNPPTGPDPERAEMRRLPVAPFLAVLSRRRGLIVGLTIGAAFVAAITALLSPITYESTLTILPPESSSPLGLGGGNLQSSLASLQMQFGATSTSAVYADMLRSRSVMRYAIDKLDLLDYYGLTGADSLLAYTNALKILRSDLHVETANNGIVTVTSVARTGYVPGAEGKLAARRMAAAIGNALAEGLEVVNREKNTNQARQARIYLEGQLVETELALEAASVALADFQKEHLAISLDDQMRVSIETAGHLEGELIARQVALRVARQSMMPANPEVRRLESEVRELRNQLLSLQRGAFGEEESVPHDSMSVGLTDLPEVGRRYAFLLREVKIQETLYELLTQQLYHARIKETETMPVIQVLDEAAVPVNKKHPVVRQVTLLAAILGFLFSILLCHALEWWGQYEWRQADIAVIRSLWRR